MSTATATPSKKHKEFDYREAALRMMEERDLYRETMYTVLETHRITANKMCRAIERLRELGEPGW